MAARLDLKPENVLVSIEDVESIIQTELTAEPRLGTTTSSSTGHPSASAPPPRTKLVHKTNVRVQFGVKHDIKEYENERRSQKIHGSCGGLLLSCDRRRACPRREERVRVNVWDF